MRRSQSFQNKLILLFLFSIILPISILSSCLAFYLQNRIQKENETYFSTTLYEISSNMSTYFSDLQRMALTPYIYDDIINFYTAVDNAQYTEEGPANYRIGSYRQNYIFCMQRLMITSRDDILSISFMPKNPKNQMILTTSRNRDLLETADYRYNDQYWFADGFLLDEPFRYSITDPLPFMNTQSEVIATFHTVKNINTKRKLGILRIDSSLAPIRGMFDSVKLTPHSGFIIVDQNRKPIYHEGYLDDEAVPYLLREGAKIRTSGDTYLRYQRSIKGMPWTLVFLSSYHDNMKSILLIWILAAILGVLTIIAGCLFFRKNSQKTTIVLNSILSAMESASNGNLDIHIPEELMARNDFYVADEFTMIGEHLNEMIHQLDLYIQRSYKNEIQRQEAEYRALQSQINPHFLYNTLNCFVSLNRLGMKKELEAGILQLTHIFRYTCSNSKTTTVAQELQFCTQYCELMKLRFDERITYVCECAEATREIEIPRLLIQPFVENAMKHGMDPDGRSITIWTAACIDHGTLVLSIKNNGIPIDLDTLRASEHVGIMNVENRLKIFDPDARLDITLEDGITSFTVYIPMKGGGTTDISAE